MDAATGRTVSASKPHPAGQARAGRSSLRRTRDTITRLHTGARHSLLLRVGLVAPVVILFCALLPAAAAGLSGCDRSSSHIGGQEAASSSSPGSTTTLNLPPGEPIEIHRFAGDQTLWEAWIVGDYVLWEASAGPVSPTGLDFSQSPDWDTVFGAAGLNGAKTPDVSWLRIPPPEGPDGTSSVLRLPLAWAAVLSGASGEPFKLLWGLPPEKVTTDYRFRGMFSWSPGEEPVEVLPTSTLSIGIQASGDAVAIALPVFSYSSIDDDANDPSNWQSLLMMTAAMDAPAEVDPTAPRLPEPALAGFSPYFALRTVTADGKASGPIFDLRTGQRLSVELPAFPPTRSAVAGRFACWCTQDGDVYLADLETGDVQKVLSIPTASYELPAVALGDEWLVALIPQPAGAQSPGAGQDPGAAGSSTTLPSQRPGADLVAFHLPDLRRVEIPVVVGRGEAGGVQVSGDLVLLRVAQAVDLMPHNQPDWVALRVLRIE